MTPAKKISPKTNASTEGKPEEPALTQEAISQVAGRGTVQSNPVSEPTLMPSPPIIPPQPSTATPPQASSPEVPAWMLDPHLNDSMPPAEDTTVSLLRTTTYSMPGTCPVCSEPRLGGTGKIQTSNSYRSGNMKYTLSLAFPICQKCTSIQQLFSKYSNKAMLIAIPFGVIGAAVVVILGTSNPGSDAGGYICGSIFAGFVLWGIATAIINPILTKKLPKTLRDRNSRIGGAAAISSFSPTHVSFKFKNKAYAAAFQLLNTSGGLNLMQQMLDTLNKKPSN